MTPEVALELAARRLEGETLLRVFYLDPWDGAARPAAPLHDRDRVGLAVVLELSSGRRVEVRWADELGLRHGFGIAMREVKILDADRGRLEEVSPRWGDRVGARIARASIQWGRVDQDLRSGFQIMVAIHADHLARPDYPRALELRLEGAGPVTIEAARIEPGGKVVGFVNDLLVTLG